MRLPRVTKDEGQIVSSVMLIMLGALLMSTGRPWGYLLIMAGWLVAVASGRQQWPRR